MGESNTGPATGVVLAGGRARVWVEQGALHWRRGRTTVVVPGTRIRQVVATEKSLTVFLFEDTRADSAMTVRHRNRDMVAALGAEVEAIMTDADPSGNRQPLRRHAVRMWPLRTVAGLRDRVLHGSPWWRRAFWYVVLGLPPAVGLPVDRLLGFFAWLLLPAAVALLRMWVGMAEVDTWWVMRRRGITVHARYEADPDSEATSSCIAHFRTIDGQEVTASLSLRGWRDEITYDPQNPSRVLAPTRVAWLGVALVAFMVTGLWGVVCSVPAILWLIDLLAPR
ncbi:hypothetical protein R6V09_19040 [Streptomyces sp. W16]|uniref:hypothetical protein n=1 Tax=Streptomyces sp. W16 TaxID=3076631 RepID=UPI00295B7035|nr:hypothetical protein [Streptomyces sp. W16]MDV9172195.1 hypothetical protein [Streptomyces sp. W16]